MISLSAAHLASESLGMEMPILREDSPGASRPAQPVRAPSAVKRTSVRQNNLFFTAEPPRARGMLRRAQN